MSIKSTQEVRTELRSEFRPEQLQYAVQIMRDVLREMAVCPNDAPAPYGVCSALDRRVDYMREVCFDAYKLVRLAGEDWEHARFDHGELQAYFVPCTEGYGLWQGPNRAMRVLLIEHMIEHCEALLGD